MASTTKLLRSISVKNKISNIFSVAAGVTLVASAALIIATTRTHEAIVLFAFGVTYAIIAAITHEGR